MYTWYNWLLKIVELQPGKGIFSSVGNTFDALVVTSELINETQVAHLSGVGEGGLLTGAVGEDND